MMRLIDANKLKKAFVGNRYGTKAIEYIIDSVPAVEAIPVEWLADFCYKCEKETQQLSEIRLAVETWRKENEKQTVE